MNSLDATIEPEQVALKKPPLMTVDQANALPMDKSLELFKQHINPNLGRLYALLGLASRRPVHAEGMKIQMDDGSSVLDFTAGLAVLALGHNHPKVVEARRKWADEQRLECWKFIPGPQQAVLAKNLSSLMPGDLDIAFFCNSGAEANEGALKLASKYAGVKRDLIAYTDNSFHGKTMGTLSVSGSERYNSKAFKKLDGCVPVPYGDADALERLFADNTDRFGFGKCRISTFIVEAIRSEGVVIPPKGYLARVRELCSKYDVVMICDEVFCGFGRTGELFAFNHEGIVPDIVSLSKAFGAGKATFAAFVTRPKFFHGAYGNLKEATLHSTTFNGYGEELVAAITGMHVLYDEDLIRNSRRMGVHLLDGLRKLKNKYPRLITEVNGIGLLACIKTENALAKSMAALLPKSDMGRETFAKFTTAGIISQLYTKHDILTYTPLHDSSQILITPPLIVSETEIDQFIAALDDVLQSNVVEHGVQLAKRAFGL